MMIGDRSFFAIESEISKAYEQLSLRALGFFVLYVAGRQYGVRKPDATMLANSFDEVSRRLASRGTHTAPFSSTEDAGELANAVIHAQYAEGQDHTLFFGLSQDEFCQLLHTRGVLWAPDGDEAFDDRSCVLQMDVDDRVRMIAFKRERGYLYAPTTLSDVWLSGSDFYSALGHWLRAFEEEWRRLPKSKPAP
jgi:hypothetical protein